MELYKKKVFFNAGDKVKDKHNLKNAPEVMIVAKVNKYVIKPENKSQLVDIKCYWYDSTGKRVESCYNSKDLIKLEND